ncbi:MULTISPECIES: HalOD1 output domain-containing protein [Natrialbaceae]|uniref:HalOD1 output domain-containing protein n=1 Tax=Natrialbaceae TaxID=1644061 RepID=UPI00207CF9A0|nr:HalOD1 output domain-containing protein [Natronococcus sp. CG52]
MSNSESEALPIRSRYDWSTISPSLAVIDALATAEETDPEELAMVSDTTLYTHVDPEALDTVVADGDRVTVSFTIGDYRVRIDGDVVTIGDS